MSNSIYFGAVAKSLENRLLNQANFENLIDCKNLDELKDQLKICSLLHSEKIENYSDLEQIVKLEEENFLKFIKRESPKESYTKFFCLDNDYFNLEALYLKNYKKSEECELKPEGFYPISVLSEAVNKKNCSVLTKNMSNCLNYLNSLEKESKLTGFLLDTAFKKALMQDKLVYSKCNKHLKSITQFMIDASNIELSLTSLNYESFLLSKLDGGSLDDKFFELLSSRDYKKILSNTRHQVYAKLIELLVVEYSNNHPITKFERMVELYGVNYFEEQKYKLDEDVPYLRYCYLKLNEIDNLRLIFSGLKLSLNKEAIKNELKR